MGSPSTNGRAQHGQQHEFGGAVHLPANASSFSQYAPNIRNGIGDRSLLGGLGILLKDFSDAFVDRLGNDFRVCGWIDAGRPLQHILN